MATLKRLSADGWHVDDFKLREVLAENYNEGASAVEWVQALSDLDIRGYGAAIITDRTDKTNTLRGPIIVQLSKWENVSFPKINEHTKNDGVCSMILTDGHKSIKAMATEPLTLISGDTPYGSKIYLNGVLNFENGILQLNNSNTKFIGGNVDKLVEKWRSEKYSSNKVDRALGDAPKWVPFGKRRGALAPQKDGFKAMPGANAEAKANSEANAEFEAARQSEIAVLMEVKKNAPSYLKQPEKAPKKDFSSKKELDSKVIGNQVHQQVPPKSSTVPGATVAASGNVRGQRRRRDNETDIRTYINRPTGGGTIFDLIKDRLGDEVDASPPPFTPVGVVETKTHFRHNNRQSSTSKPNNPSRDRNQHPASNQTSYHNNRTNHVRSHTEAISDTSFAPLISNESFHGREDGPHGDRDNGSRCFTSSTFFQNYPPLVHPTIQPLFANTVLQPPPGVEIGRHVVAPYIDGNVSSPNTSVRGSKSRGGLRGSSRGNSGSSRGRGSWRSRPLRPPLH